MTTTKRPKPMQTESEEEIELLRLWRKLAECDQEAIVQQIKEWIEVTK